MVSRAVFLDRDGVINKSFTLNGKPKAPLTFKEFRFLPNSKKSISLLVKNNFLVFVITNQPDIGNGITKLSEVILMHDKICNQTEVKEIFLCPHSQKNDCSCRKPKAQFVLLAKKKYILDLTRSYFIGDRFADVQTGINAGCKTIFINRQYDEACPEDHDYEVKNIYQAVKLIINKKAY